MTSDHRRKPIALPDIATRVRVSGVCELGTAHLTKFSEKAGLMTRVIAARALTKDYGDKRAVDELSFSVRPGLVTGFLEPNGSGKSTTMRLILELDAPTAGEVTVN